MRSSELASSDVILLFLAFPFDFKTNLPINMGAAVCLDYTPQDVLRHADPPGLADFVLPGYSVVPDWSIAACENLSLMHCLKEWPFQMRCFYH